MDNAAIEEMFETLGPVSIRRMFGGKGIYHAGTIFALEIYGDILLKADEIAGMAFAKAGARQWTYEGKSGKPVKMPYWTIPDEALDDPEILAGWVRLSYEAALRSASRAAK